MYCNFCGQEIDDNSAYCKYCGEAAEQKPSDHSAVLEDQSPPPEPFPDQKTSEQNNCAVPNTSADGKSKTSPYPPYSSAPTAARGTDPNLNYGYQIPPYPGPATGYPNSSFPPGYLPPPIKNPADKSIYKILLIILCIFQGLVVVGIFAFYIVFFLFLISDSPDASAQTQTPSSDSYENYETIPYDDYFDTDPFYDGFGDGYGDPFYDYGYYDFRDGYEDPFYPEGGEEGPGSEYGEDEYGDFFEIPEYDNFFNRLPYYRIPDPPAKTL